MRQIDMGEPLSDEDRDWLLANNGEEAVRRNAEEHGYDLPEGMATSTPGGMPVVTGMEPAHASDRLYPTGLTPTTVEADLDRERRDAQFKAALEAEQDGEGVSPLGQRGLTVETDDNPYEQWKVSALQAELGKRELSKSGNKEELAGRLRVNDEEQADIEPADTEE